MFSAFRQFCERVLRIPPTPEPPPGDEAQTRIFRAAPQFYKYLLALWALRTVAAFLIVSVALGIPLVGATIAASKQGERWAFLLLLIPLLVLGLVLISQLFALAVVRLDFEKRWYVVTDRSLRVREGIFLIREATVTFANIQNISISQGPIQRALGLSDLRVETAGGGGATQGRQGMHNLHTVFFRGVNNANEIKELMQQRLRQLKDSGLGDHDDVATGSPPAVAPAILGALREVHAEAVALRIAASSRRGPAAS